MTAPAFFSAPTKLLAWFLLLAGIPLAALGWLGWRLLEQDRALENQRTRERLANAASLLTHELDQRLAGWEDLLPQAAKGAAVPLPPGAALLVFNSGGVLRRQGARLPYYPLLPPQPEAPENLFAEAESREFAGKDPARAAALYRGLARTGNRRVRAGALVRLGRCLRKQQRLEDALEIYAELAALGETPVAGSPAELLARRERMALLADGEARRRESALLASALSQGRFRIDRASFEFYGEPLHLQAGAVAEAVETMWPRWRQQPSGRADCSVRGRTFVSVWRETPPGGTALVAGVEALETPLLPAARDLRVRFTLAHPADPGSLRVASAEPGAEQAVALLRRNLLVAGFGLIVLVVAAASYFVFRAVSRELGVARLQSDFVAAVSHEFRTPLTAMSHMTEMLEEGATPGERLPVYYHALGKETRRLRGMVESLLDFGRMEAGRRIFHMEDLDAAELVRGAVEEFRDQANSHRFELEMPAGERRLCADREALARALRNLLDNAVKYSPESSTVKVSLESQGKRVAISVQDQGAGIPKDEQRQVFQKFVRGSSSGTLSVKGTGIGLAMVDHIVKAHGGEILLDSAPGRGSRFIILLPVEPRQR